MELCSRAFWSLDGGNRTSSGIRHYDRSNCNPLNTPVRSTRLARACTASGVSKHLHRSPLVAAAVAADNTVRTFHYCCLSVVARAEWLGGQLEKVLKVFLMVRNFFETYKQGAVEERRLASAAAAIAAGSGKGGGC